MLFKPRILVVDDEPQMLQFLGEALTQMQTEPPCVPASREAAELVNREKFDGVFLDWMMPEMDGLELAQHIRWSKSNSLCPIVMVTGNPEPDGIRQCFQAGMNLFLRKPVSVEQVRHMVTATRDLMLQERLRYQRLAVQIPVACQWQVQSLEQRASGQSVNLSTTGMLVKLGATPAHKDLVKLKFKLPGNLQPLMLTAYVVRFTRNQEVGLRFVNLTREERRRLMEFSMSALGL